MQPECSPVLKHPEAVLATTARTWLLLQEAAARSELLIKAAQVKEARRGARPGDIGVLLPGAVKEASNISVGLSLGMVRAWSGEALQGRQGFYGTVTTVDCPPQLDHQRHSNQE